MLKKARLTEGTRQRWDMAGPGPGQDQNRDRATPEREGGTDHDGIRSDGMAGEYTRADGRK